MMHSMRDIRCCSCIGVVTLRMLGTLPPWLFSMSSSNCRSCSRSISMRTGIRLFWYRSRQSSPNIWTISLCLPNGLGATPMVRMSPTEKLADSSWPAGLGSRKARSPQTRGVFFTLRLFRVWTEAASRTAITSALLKAPAARRLPRKLLSGPTPWPSMITFFPAFFALLTKPA